MQSIAQQHPYRHPANALDNITDAFVPRRDLDCHTALELTQPILSSALASLTSLATDQDNERLWAVVYLLQMSQATLDAAMQAAHCQKAPRAA